VLTILAVFVLFVANVVVSFGWFRAQHTLRVLDREKAALQASNKALEGAHELLRNKRAQFCNRTGDDVTIHWMAAAFEDGGHLRQFDSQRCQDWQPVPVQGGQSRALSLSSTQPGCNWNGSVIFHAMFFSRTAEDATRDYRVAGAWYDYEKECYTLQ
jgi:hypothetical protein